MQYRFNREKMEIQGRKDENSNYSVLAWIDSDSKLIFSGDFPDKLCNEIERFLESQCIYLNELNQAYTLVN